MEIVSDGSTDVGRKELTRYCLDHLVPFKVPRAIRLIGADAISTTTTGKVQKYPLAQTAK